MLIKKAAVQMHITIFDPTAISTPLLETNLTKQTDSLGAILLPNVMDLIVGSEIGLSKQYYIRYEYKALGESIYRVHSLNPIWLLDNSDSIPEDGRESHPRPHSVSGDVPIIKYYISGDVPIIRLGAPSVRYQIPKTLKHEKDSIQGSNASNCFEFKHFYCKGDE